jgi:AraC-like DNA-binding protein
VTSEADYAPTSFSTADLPERDRFPMWHDLFCRKMLQVSVESLSEGPFYTRATFRTVPGLRTAAFESCAVRHERTRDLAAGGDGNVSLVINLDGTLAASQNGRDVTLGAGDATVVSHSDPGTVMKSQGRWAGVIVPYKAIAALVIDLDDAPMRLVSRDADAFRLLMTYVNAVRDDLVLASPEMRRMVATHVADLFALTIGASRDGAEIANARGARAARLRAIKAEIAANSGSRDLTVAAIAQRHGITPRSVQTLFETEGTTFSEYLLAQRLARAHSMLTDPRHAKQSISTIAYAAGFGDLSYFNRTFRRRYGVVPSDIRGLKR